jgi:hypothetical protein
MAVDKDREDMGVDMDKDSRDPHMEVDMEVDKDTGVEELGVE